MPTPSQSRSTSTPGQPCQRPDGSPAEHADPIRTPLGRCHMLPPSRPFRRDWHIEFSIEGKVIPNETNHLPCSPQFGPVSRGSCKQESLVCCTHSQVPARTWPPPPESIAFGASFDSSLEVEDGSTPGSLAKHPTTASILRLLKKLHDLNANIDDVIVENKETIKVNVEPLSQFVNHQAHS